MRGNKALMQSAKSGGSDNHETPMNVLNKVHALFGGIIDLDPCTTALNPTGAQNIFCPPADGLEKNWMDGTYVNPPYSQIKKWSARCATSHMLEGNEIVLLCPARTDTKWWHENVVKFATAICYVKGRLKFVGQLHGAPFPSAIVYYGKRVQVFDSIFNDLGDVRWMIKSSIT